MKSTDRPNLAKSERFYQVALQHYQAQNVQLAIAACEEALRFEPRHSNALNLYAGLLIGIHNFEKASSILKQSIKVTPNNFLLYYNLGVLQRLLGHTTEALTSFDHAIRLKEDFAEAWLNKGVVLAGLERVLEAIECYGAAINFKKNFAEAYLNLGNAHLKLQQIEQASEAYAKAIEVKHDYAQAYFNFAVLEQKRSNHVQAITFYKRSIELNPDYADAFGNLGIAYKKLGLLPQAIEAYAHAIKINPNYYQAYSNMGTALKDDRRSLEALEAYDKALELKPDYAEALSNKGNLLQDLRQFDEATRCYEAAIKLSPQLYRAHLNYGNLLKDLKRYDKAFECYDRAIKIRPDFAVAYSNRGSLFLETKRPELAIIDYQAAHQIDPCQPYLLGTKLHAEMQICDWRNFEQDTSRLAKLVDAGESVTPCLPLLALLDDASLQKKAAQRWIADKHPENTELGEINKWPGHNKIKVGYFSADFHNHATTYLMAELFELHDMSKFDIYAFSYGPEINDQMRARVKGAVTSFIDVRLLSDKDVAQLARSLEIDIAVDLKGLTLDHRLGIFSYRAAPVQLSYIGYPGSLGAPYIDYALADHVVVPKDQESHYTEKILRMPGSYQVNDSKRAISSRIFTRQEMGLPPNGFIFACFNNNFKITPHYFEVWMRLLAAVESSVLWLFEDNPQAAINLRQHAAAAGIDPQRLIFAKRISAPDHLARQKLADLFLDTGPYNAHTTASDALWVGLPVLTCLGHCFAARVAASLLFAHGVPELVTGSLKEYEEKAIELAESPKLMASLRDKVVQNKLNSLLFNTRRFVIDLESIYKSL